MSNRFPWSPTAPPNCTERLNGAFIFRNRKYCDDIYMKEFNTESSRYYNRFRTPGYYYKGTTRSRLSPRKPREEMLHMKATDRYYHMILGYDQTYN